MAAVNPWHDVKVGEPEDIPRIINAIIEIPKDSWIKYELDKDTGLLKMDRFLYSAVHYPGDYGFVPQTLWDDNDPLDIMILTGTPLHPLCLAKVKVIGVIRIIDGDEKDDKILAVYNDDPRFSEYQDISDIPSHTKQELKHFFETYKQLQGKKCRVLEIRGKEDALKDVQRAVEMYKEKFGKN